MATLPKAVQGLTFARLRAANRERSPASGSPVSKNAVGVIADTSKWTPAEWLECLVGELGEYANIRKKFRRGDFDEATMRAAAAKELADVQCYLDKLSDCLGIDLGAATVDKFNEVSVRVDCKVFL